MQQPFKNFKVLIVKHDEHSKNSMSVKTQDAFHKISAKIANKVGNAWSFFIALAIIIIWAVSGPLFNFSDTWQLIINTGTTIVTFLMVFVIQNTQNRDARAVHLKLDELIDTSRTARSEFVDIEDLSDSELDELNQHFKEVKEKLHGK